MNKPTPSAQPPISHDHLDPSEILRVLTALKKGDFTARLPVDRTGIAGKIADTLNDVVELNERMTGEFARVSTIVGKEGRTSHRADLEGAVGQWADCVDSVNTLVADLVQPTTEVSRVLGAVANGDLSQKMALEIEGRPLTGEFLRTASTVNTMVDQLGTFAAEVTRVAREVGTDGKLGGQAEVRGVAGTWKDLTDSVNSMAMNLTNQVRNIADVTTAVATGDLTKKVTVDVKGELLELKNTMNTMVDQLNSFASEVTRVAREVGTEGKLSGQAQVRGVGGTWKDLTDNVNLLVGNLTGQVRNIAEVTTAVANGDLSRKITVDAQGEILELKNTINTMVDQLSTFAAEVTRVAREVGTEGALGGQADVRGVAGTWRDLTESVNSMASNLTNQVRNIADVASAVANGDLTKTITVDARGELLELKNTINTMVDQVGTFAAEVTRVAREVGTEGKLGGQAQVRGVGGTWKDLTDNVNLLVGNLTGQVRNIAEVATAIANGDLSRQITVDAQGEILELKNTINTMVDQVGTFAAEVTRVAREVGTDGKLGGQAEVRGVAGTWRDLTESVNSMASNLTNQVRNIAEVASAVANGDLTKTITVDARGELLELKSTINTMVDQVGTFAAEVTRVAREVGTEGKLGGQAQVRGVGGTWKDLTDNVNLLVGNLTGQVRNIAEVATAIANGDLSRQITVDAQGEILELKNTINTMVDQVGTFAAEVTRVAREVGTDGKLGGQAEVIGVGGTWKDLTDNLNLLVGNLTGQVRNIAEVATAVANGDLTKTITVDARGEILELKNTINTMVDQLGTFAAEVTRVAREVGTEGILGGQADVRGVSGTWKDLTDSMNSMASNLTSQVRNIAEVATAIANGDLGRRITVESKGEILQLKDTINKMVDYLNQLASEVGRVTRVAAEEGKLTELTSRATVEGATGAWKVIVDTLNFLLDSLAMPVTEIGRVVTAISEGDLSQKMPFRWQNEMAVSRGDTAQRMEIRAAGDIRSMAETINKMVDDLNTFAGEVTRVAREVGTDGKLGGQADVPGVAGTWKDLTDNVNSMAGNLTAQVRNIAEVTTAVARGDLSKTITAEARGEILELKNTINTMVDQLSSFAAEVTRVAREVGTDGKLGGQAVVEGVSGVWKDLTDNVNSMAGNLTAQVRNIADVTTAVANGDLSRKITVDVRGEFLQLKDTMNTMVEQLRSFASEVTRVAREVGTDGKLGGQAYVSGVSGTWKDLTDNVNFMAANLTSQVRNIAAVTTAVANGDLSRKITVDVKGEMLELKDTANTMVDQLNSFASEVTRVAREVGTDGVLGGQAQVRGVSGTWKDLTDNVNSMAANLTSQVRGIAKVVTAVANGDLEQKLTVEAKGEIASLADTINAMTDTLATFADQVTTVAREVGVDGRLGGQANVPGAAGTWRDLVDNVNRLAANLTTQVRAIADVATAVTKGDLSRSVTVEALGEVASLKDNINEMIRNLRDTTRVNSEQDWLKTNLAQFTRRLQGQRDLIAVARMILSELAPLVNEHAGLFYVHETQDSDPALKLLASYGFQERKHLSNRFRAGEGLVGQCLLEKQRILLRDVPDDYIKVTTGLGEATPANIVVLPVVFEGNVLATIELASFQRFSDTHLAFLDQLTESIGIVLNTIAATTRTEELLKQSQTLAAELQSGQQELTDTNRRLEQQAKSLQESEELLKRQQEELQQTNEELEEKAQLLADQNREVERKNQEIDLARGALQERAEQLALTSKYKSEFLANMSHELRTPLNSMLILSRLLGDNEETNLTGKQVEFAQTIHSSGSDLLALINDILDLSKIESGTVEVELADVPVADLTDFVERTFRPVADGKKLRFTMEVGSRVPASLHTDAKRLQQVLKNLLSNAMKFTEAGSVAVSIEPATSGWSPDIDTLNQAEMVVAFSVADTGIGIPLDKQRVIFEAFQQADGTTSRTYGGTGLGLSISREIARLLGGEIRLESTPGQGSTFTLYLPATYAPPAPHRVRDHGPAGDPGSGGDTAPGTPPPPAPLARGAVDDDRADLQPGDRTVLIVEDDVVFAGILLDMARERGFKGMVAVTGEEALSLAGQRHPDAITLDIRLPDTDGWALLDLLKHNPATRHIPVHVITVEEEERRGKALGAVGYVRKPATKEALDATFAEIAGFLDRPARRLLVVEDDRGERESIIGLIGNGDVESTGVGTGTEALAALRADRFDCVVLDIGLPDMTGFQLLNSMREGGLAGVPIVVYTGRELTKKEETELRRAAQSIVVKGARSPERLLDETTLFLHRVEANLPAEKRRMVEQARRADPALAGKKVLIVDDDVRNIFALTSILERQSMQVVYAENGKDGVELLQRTPGVDAVLMDVMMPEMDGYETMRIVRGLRKYRSLPIIALTAKAMKGDREKCIEAGASDYIAKPVDPDRLLSLLRVWLSR